MGGGRACGRRACGGRACGAPSAASSGDGFPLVWEGGRRRGEGASGGTLRLAGVHIIRRRHRIALAAWGGLGAKWSQSWALALRRSCVLAVRWSGQPSGAASDVAGALSSYRSFGRLTLPQIDCDGRRRGDCAPPPASTLLGRQWTAPEELGRAGRGGGARRGRGGGRGRGREGAACQAGRRQTIDTL